MNYNPDGSIHVSPRMAEAAEPEPSPAEQIRRHVQSMRERADAYEYLLAGLEAYAAYRTPPAGFADLMRRVSYNY